MLAGMSGDGLQSLSQEGLSLPQMGLGWEA